ncbi:ATP-binding cassette subfamily G member 4 isoform X2 [Episyrphus balteatus]|uniref:ATP-binding cassette subfamily G member 4 isoform X2 n=1 Tax=Episyrphus balteatus TaxID=286459 RepID=UPI0024852BE1|nr:ATP-binding cassette subfamily G member 4 isoform X2 [Episyrphus balteatus]
MELITRSVISNLEVQSIDQSSFQKQNSMDKATITTDSGYENKNKLKRLNIQFENIKYVVRTGFFRKDRAFTLFITRMVENKTVLKGLTGELFSGELSAIVGPSGAGKSSLLNILSGYELHGASGNVFVNGTKRNIDLFRTNLSFIKQDTDLQPFLTVSEAMHFSTNLKTGNSLSTSEKKKRVQDILHSVGMYKIRKNSTGKLSGGEKKRLAVALELVNNPTVLILDEPTTGLDSLIANQCILLLKKLAQEGRTIVCTIHQPSGLAIQMFDALYAIADGKCIYSGATRNLVPFLAQVDLKCPEIYNPVDYLMEIATDDYGKQNHKLTEKIRNGRNRDYVKTIQAGYDVIKNSGIGKHYVLKCMYYKNYVLFSETRQSGSTAYTKETSNELKHNVNIKDSNLSCYIPKNTITAHKLCKRENVYATPFYLQTIILLERTFLILWRDKGLTLLRIVVHLIMAALVGILYYGIGNDAGNALNNFRYIFYTLMFVMYTSFSSILVNFPLEFPIVTREHFNRWYSLRAYYIAFTLADIPIQIICTSVFIVISYTLTGQPIDITRISLFGLITFLTALVAQSIGLAVGASLSIKYGAILGPLFICPFLAFSGFFLRQNDAQEWLKWIFSISFLKYGLEGASLAIFGFNRPKMDCHKIYCHYARPKTFLKNIGMENGNFGTAAIFLLVLFLGLRILAFYIISFRIRIFR